MQIIDVDQSGTVSFEEFALWWIAGREGAPDNLAANIAGYLQKT